MLLLQCLKGDCRHHLRSVKAVAVDRDISVALIMLSKEIDKAKVPAESAASLMEMMQGIQRLIKATAMAMAQKSPTLNDKEDE